MYYPNLTTPTSIIIPHKTTISLLISSLTIPPQQRSLHDHQLVFQFFYNNKILCDIQRLKSLNAKQQCVANLVMVDKMPVGKDGEGDGGMIFIDEIVMPDVEDKKEEKEKKQGKSKKKQQLEPQKYYVLLPTQKKQQIMSADQKYLRANIQKLKKYIILKNMKYQQMLHLAYYMDEISYKYKQVVYREGDEIDYLYLVEKGQFHYSKLCVDQSERQKKKSKKERPKRYDAKIDNPNRLKNSRSVEVKIGVIQGEGGQCFGEEEIVAEKQRQYTVKCMSTQNVVLRVPYQKYRRILSTQITRMQWLKKQNQKKIQLKDEMLNRMKTVKSNYKKYAQIIKTNLNKTQLLRSDPSVGNSQTQIRDYESGGNFSLNANDGTRMGSMLPRIKSQSMASDQYRFTKRNSSQNEGIAEQYQSSMNKKSYQSEESEGDNMFSLTKANSRKRKYEVERQNTSLHVPVSTSNSHATILPTLTSEKNKATSTYQTIQSNLSKNWSATRPILELRGLRNKFSGMIDVNSLVKQKQEILNIKMMGKEFDKEIYPFHADKSSKPNIAMMTKQETREMRSAVHSKAFMQRLLVEALKKAGYNAEKNAENYTEDTPNSVVDIKNNLRLPKSRVKIQKYDAGSLLQDNQFDECYFRKIE